MQRRSPWMYGVGFYLLVFLLAILFLNSPGTSDVQIFLKWMATTRQEGLVNGYNQLTAAAADRYPPLAFVLLFAANQIGAAFQLDAFASLKLLLFLFLLLTTLAFYIYSRDLWLTIRVQLALTLSSVALGYLDILTAPFLLLSLLALKRGRVVISAFLFSICFLIKFQPIVIAPFIAVYILGAGNWRQLLRVDIKRVVAAGLAALILPVLLALVFGPILLTSFRNTAKVEFLSGYGLNLNWILSYWMHVFAPDLFGPLLNGEITLIKPGAWSLLTILDLAFLFIYAVILLRFVTWPKTWTNFLCAALLGYLTYFMIMPDVHENHLFVAVILSVLLGAHERRYLPLFLSWAVAANLNLFIFYGVDGQGLAFGHVVAGLDMSLLLAIANLVLFCISLREWFTVRQPTPMTMGLDSEQGFSAPINTSD